MKELLVLVMVGFWLLNWIIFLIMAYKVSKISSQLERLNTGMKSFYDMVNTYEKGNNDALVHIANNIDE